LARCSRSAPGAAVVRRTLDSTAQAAVIEAVRGGWMSIEEACRVYNISVDEFLAWERDIDRNGVPGLRSTRYQIYRDTDIPR
jgi:hypothetical protein